MPSPPNTTNITPPRVPVIDPRTGLISREWYRFFLNLFTNTGGGTGVTPIANGGTNSTSTPRAGAVAYGDGQSYKFTTVGTAGQFLTSTGIGAPAWTTSTAGTVTSVGQTFTGGLISVTGSPVTSSGTLALTVAGTSGGVPYFSSASTWESSAALAANALVIGGGAGVAPATTTTGTGVVTALGVNTGTAGAFVVNGGALGTPASGTVTNLTGTASININGTVGATTPATGVFTTIAFQAPSLINAATYTVATTDVSLRFTTTACTVTLPAAASFTGRVLYLNNVTLTATVTSASSNVIPLGSNTAGTAILGATAGKFAMIQSDGTNWITMMAN